MRSIHGFFLPASKSCPADNRIAECSGLLVQLLSALLITVKRLAPQRARSYTEGAELHRGVSVVAAWLGTRLMELPLRLFFYCHVYASNHTAACYLTQVTILPLSCEQFMIIYATIFSISTVDKGDATL